MIDSDNGQRPITLNASTIKGSQFLRICNISVRDLFGNLNHDVPLSRGGVTFIHGPNGCGKTTILRLVQALLTGDLQTLKTVDFSELTISYDDGVSLVATRTLARDRTDGLFEDEEELLRAAFEISVGFYPVFTDGLVRARNC